MISPAVKKNIQDYLKGILPVLILLALCSVGAGIIAAQFINDPVIVEAIVVGTLFLLLFWWGFIAWRQKSNWVMKLQELMLSNQMISFNFTKIKSNMPWNVDQNRERLFRAAAAEYQTLRERAKDTQQTLEKYVGSNVSSKATEKAARSELGGESRRVYVLFSDVRSFTRMAEQLQPQETVEILNKMFTAMEEVITQNGGDINKYIGDAIFAYFRRPYSNEGEAAKLVLRTALRMQDRFALLNQAFKVVLQPAGGDRSRDRRHGGYGHRGEPGLGQPHGIHPHRRHGQSGFPPLRHRQARTNPGERGNGRGVPGLLRDDGPARPSRSRGSRVCISLMRLSAND